MKDTKTIFSKVLLCCSACLAGMVIESIVNNKRNEKRFKEAGIITIFPNPVDKTRPEMYLETNAAILSELNDNDYAVFAVVKHSNISEGPSIDDKGKA